MTKHSYVAKFKRKDETVFTKRFLASDLFEAVEHALEYATKRDIPVWTPDLHLQPADPPLCRNQMSPLYM